MTDTLEHASDADLTALLEQDYRRQLRWYPRSWRDSHGDALVGTLLDEADDTDRFTLAPGEWRSFAAAGTAARLDRVIMRPVRDAAATVLLGAGAGISLVVFVVSSWAPWRTGTDAYPAAFGPFADAGVVLEALWVIALVAAVAGRWWIGRLALLLSVLVAMVMRPIEPLLAPPHAFSLDSGTLTLSVTAALLTMLGTPRTRRPLLAALAGGVALAAAAVGYRALSTYDGYVGSPISALLADPVRTGFCLALALGVAAVLAIARFWTPAFTVLLTVLPPAAAVPDYELFQGPYLEPAGYFSLIFVPVAAGLVLLVLVSRNISARSNRADTRAPSDGLPTGAAKRTRQRAGVVTALSAVLILGSVGSALTASGLNWSRPAAANWANYWRLSAETAAPQGEDFFATLNFTLPSGGTCTTRFFSLGQLPNIPPDPATTSARDYLINATENGSLLRDAQISQVIASQRTQNNEQRTEDNRLPNFWGVFVPYGYGTANYNPDVEYFEAEQLGVESAQRRHLNQAGYPDAETAFSWTGCKGMQQ